jgi:flagellar assembly protein FliH
MSSSPSRAPEVPLTSHTGPPSAASPEVLPFYYGEVQAAAGGRRLPGGAFSGSRSETVPAAPTNQALERESQARESGRQQGVIEAAKRFDEQLLRERAAIAAALAKFAGECTAYYRRIEEEAVQLSLAIARKVLHREAQVDPLLLMGIVRVALDRIDGSTKVDLAVHPQRAADWQRHLASVLSPAKLPEVVEDPAMPLDQCELRTSMGTAPLGVEVQLKEIEQGLMDLLAARPPAGP